MARGRDTIIVSIGIAWNDDQLSMKDAMRQVKRHLYTLGDINSDINIYEVDIYQWEV